MRRSVVELVVVLVAALGACGGTGASTATQNTAHANKSTDMANGHVPHALEMLEADAEDVGDLVPHDRWNRVRADATRLMATWQTYRPRAIVDGAAASIVAQLDRAIVRVGDAAHAKASADASQASNDVSGAVVELFALYRPTRPVDIGRLDVVGRQIVLDVDRRNVAGATADAQRVRSIWAGGLRADVLAHEGGRVAARMDTTVDALRHAADEADSGALRVHAIVILEIVDNMEALY